MSLAAAISISSEIAAQDKDYQVDSLAFVNASWVKTEMSKGAEAMYAKLHMFNSQQSISVVRYPAKEFITEMLHRPGKTSDIPSEIGEELGATFVINGGYFHVKERIPSVFFRVGKKIHGFTHPSELYRIDGIIGFRDKKGRKMQIVHCPDTLHYIKESRKMKSVLASGPHLISDGKIIVPEMMGDKDEKTKFYNTRHPRTAIGSDDSGNIYLLVIDGRSKGQADGASVFETAYICHLLGMTNAINLDGGGSSALWTKTNGVMSHPTDNRKFDHNGERPVPNLIVVY